jgi:16S rRNA (uracil1498-N3)-methyltransferase
MADRYYSAEPITGPEATLDGNEAHHLLHVMRAEPGTKLVVFDGRGGQFDAEVVRCDRKTVTLSVGPLQDVQRELAYPLTLAVALPKGDRQRWLVEKAVELGVTRLVPLRTVRSVTNKADPASKLLRYVVEASKQCGRNRLMEITPTQDLVSFLENENTADQRLLAHPGGKSLSEIALLADASTVMVIGPEGGFTDDEVAQAVDQSWQIVGLGCRLLRVETAAIALASAITYRF